MARRVAALFRSRALADEAAARLAAALPGNAAASIAQQGPTPEDKPGMFDRLATMLAPEDIAGRSGYLVAIEVAPEQIDAAALALEPGAERVEIAAPPRLSDQVIELSETAEQLVVEKQSVLREEIIMRVQATERTEHVDAVLRRTKVEVERFGPDAERTGAKPPRT